MIWHITAVIQYQCPIFHNLWKTGLGTKLPSTTAPQRIFWNWVHINYQTHVYQRHKLSNPLGTNDINYHTLCTKRISSFVAKYQAFPLTPFPTHPTQGYLQRCVTERQKRKNVKFIKRKMAQILNQQYHPMGWDIVHVAVIFVIAMAKQRTSYL